MISYCYKNQSSINVRSLSEYFIESKNKTIITTMLTIKTGMLVCPNVSTLMFVMPLLLRK